eukprot:COSAG06_NODE_35845_length_455_cov_0.438202_1_plen_22_part_10
MLLRAYLRHNADIIFDVLPALV